MQVNQDFNPSVYIIRSYGDGHIVLYLPSDKRGAEPSPGEPPLPTKRVQRSIIITPRNLIEDWAPQTHAELTEAHFETIAALKPEIVLLGTGSKLVFPKPAFTAPLLRRGIGVETMATAAACRTYNFLVSDGRDVAVALMMM